MKIKRPSKKFNQYIYPAVFWIFNVSLLLTVVFSYDPSTGLDFWRDAFLGDVPFSLLLPVVGFVGIPVASSVLSLKTQNHSKAKKTKPPLTLTQIFYGIETPLLISCFIRLLCFRDLTPESSFIFISVLLGTLAFFHCLLTAHNPENQTVNFLQFSGLTVLVGLSYYIAVIASFYLIALAYAVVEELPMTWPMIVGLVIFFPMGILVYGCISMPYGMAIVFQSAWRQSLDKIKQQSGAGWAKVTVVAVIATWISLFLFLQQQPQKEAFQLLKSIPQSESERNALIQKRETIRKGLLNAYLHAYRYPAQNQRIIYQLYVNRSLIGQELAEGVQQLYNRLVTPFSYQGDVTDQSKAAKLYAKFFDTSILRGEHDAIPKAIRSNINWTTANAGLHDIGVERVKLEQQSVTVMPKGDWADIELHEVYANQTSANTEIFYYFSLPESAAVTGLWLGETDNKNQRYEPIVSPRGAAQQVYKNQVWRNIDPALLEQVGPRNYRLRAFPIPPALQDTLPEDGHEDRMHLWLTYRVMKHNNQWPLPTLSEQRNIFWNKDTQRIINGQLQPGYEEWLPPSLPATDNTPLQAHQAQLGDGYIFAKPLDESQYRLPKKQRLAVLLDSSYSMRTQKDELNATLQWLKREIVPHNDVRLFVTKAEAQEAQQVHDLDSFDSDNVLFYGWQQPDQILRQFTATTNSTQTYDAIVLLTDSGNYELSQEGPPVSLDAPVWLVHLGGIPAAYDDATLEAIQHTGGNVGHDIKSVMQRIATRPSFGSGTSLLNVIDGYAWYLSQSADQSQAIEPELSPLAARQWVDHLAQTLNSTDLTKLDAIHQVAKEHNIVTPYSSMIVLVNDEQRRQLNAAENKSDRFQREIEDQQVGSLPNVSAVPEPEEWSLLLLTLCLVGGIYVLKRRVTDNIKATVDPR